MGTVIGRAVAAAALAAVCLWSGTAPAETSRITVGVNREIAATLIAPDGPGPFPAVLVLHTSGGLQDADIAFAQELSRKGYVCLVPEFLDAYGITAQKRRATFTTFATEIFEDFTAAAGTLRAHPKVAGGKVGAVGFSNGGYFAMWLAATGKIAAGVSYYGALSGAGSDTSLDRFREAFAAGSSPVLVLHGTQDSIVPIGRAKRLVGILRTARTTHEVRFYDGAGHRFERDAGGEAAMEDAWTRTVAFLGRTLMAK